VGRDAELTRLDALVRAVTAGTGASVWLEGAPGIGRSTVLAAALSRAPALGVPVFLGQGDELAQHCPLQPLLEGLKITAHSPDPARRAVAEALASGSGAASDQLLALVERLAGAGPTVLAVDDLHWADETSLLLWHRLSRLTQRLPLLLVAASRPLPGRAELLTLRRGLKVAGTEVVTLKPLGDPASTALVAQLAGGLAVGPGLARAAAQAGGNPRYLTDLVQSLIEADRLERGEDTVDLADTGETLLPADLFATIGERLSFVRPETMTVLRAAARLGETFSVTDLATVAGQPADQLAPALAEAVATELLGESAARLAFRQPLVRTALQHQDPAAVRLALHRQAAQALADAGTAAEPVAGQLLAGWRDAEPEAVIDGWVVDWLQRRGHGLGYRNPQLMADLLTTVLAHLLPGDPERDRLQALLAPALVLLGQGESAARLVRPLQARTTDPARRAELAWIRAWATLDTAGYAETSAQLQPAIETARAAPVWVARLRALLAEAALLAGRYLEAEVGARAALAEAERLSDPAATASALNVLGLAQAERGDRDGANARLERALLECEFADDPRMLDLRTVIRQNRVSLLVSRGEQAAADEALGELLAETGRTVTPLRAARLNLLAAEVNYHSGRWDEALTEVNRAEPSAERMPAADRRRLHGLAALIAVHRDDQVGAETHLEAAGFGEPPPFGADHLTLARAMLAERRGRPHEALVILDRQVRAAREGPGWFDPPGDPPGAQRGWLTSLVRMAVSTGLTPDAAAPDPVTLAEDYRRAYRPLRTAYALEQLASIQARDGDLRSARAAFAQACDLYTGLRADWELRRAEVRLRPYGLQRKRTQRRGPAIGWESLTPTELTVAFLVAEGHPNPDIAAGLFLSRRTVEVHVSHILAKLGVRSRVEIAREAVRRTAEAPKPPARPAI
jgi:DNA-binding CsgD family transcriptional regulator/tetratricopeptide (TPR) repeat protein